MNKNDILSIFPSHIREEIGKFKNVTDVSLVVGQRVYILSLDHEHKRTLDVQATQQDYDEVLANMEEWNGEPVDFGPDLRSGLKGKLVRISKLPGNLTGLSLRTGKSVSNSCDLISDLISDGCLMMGPPGSRKTTVLRAIAARLARLYSVTIIDDSGGELTGFGSVDPSVDGALVARGNAGQQGKLLQMMIESHAPEYVIVDEIGTNHEVSHLRNALPKGIKIVATCHGEDLPDLIYSPVLAKLLGDFTDVILKADVARQQGLNQQTVKQRTGKAAFKRLIQMAGPDIFVIYHDLGAAVDEYLAGGNPELEIRSPFGSMMSNFNDMPRDVAVIKNRMKTETATATVVQSWKKIYAPDLSKKEIAAIKAKYAFVSLVPDLNNAQAMVVSGSRYHRMLRENKLPTIPVFIGDFEKVVNNL